MCSSTCDHSLRQFRKKSDKEFASITPNFHQELSSGLLQLRLILSCGWIRVAAVSRPGGWIWPSRVPAAGYKLRLTPSYGWLESRLLDMGCRRFRPTVDLSYGSWIRVTADYILRLTRVSAPGYDLRQIPSCDWLQVAADSILQLTRVRRLDTTCDWPML